MKVEDGTLPGNGDTWGGVYTNHNSENSSSLGQLSTSVNYVAIAREHGGEVIIQYKLPKDSASETYGPNLSSSHSLYNDPLLNYALCGDRVHYLTMDSGTTTIGLQRSGQSIQVAPYMEFEYFEKDPYAV